MPVHSDWRLTPQRAAIHLPTGTAVIADLHLGYAQARRRGGEAVPATDLETILAPLRSLMARNPIRRLVIAGDFLENACGQELIDEFLHLLKEVGLEWIGIVPGNHDRGIEQVRPDLPLYPAGLALGTWRVLHGDGDIPPGPVVLGHFHPCLRWRGITAPCFLTGKEQLVLPAFSADAAGVNVLHDPRWGQYHCHVLAGDEVLDFGVLGRLPARRREKGRRPK